ncbi:hypothetical protein LOD59_06710 [Xylella fastidiosa subsp. multiplex]|uniref:hypothetical protein n=1 Tax=Xylella fastidiosa TaxID=2371 RepID=UPI0023608D02|nr:hypothetical protein [Xylella fastidiosa]MDD0927335.1 hypothetical protein [Xylella fastidiosa subsp. multiplex]
MLEVVTRKPADGMCFKSSGGQNEVSATSESFLAEQAEFCVRYRDMKALLTRLQILKESLSDAYYFCENLSLDYFDLRMFEERKVVLDGISGAEASVRGIIRRAEERLPVLIPKKAC